LGTFVCPQEGGRIDPGVTCETEVTSRKGNNQNWFRFNADVGEQMFIRLNEKLNERTRNRQQGQKQVVYQHNKEVDRFYKLPWERGRKGNNNVRVTFNTKTGESRCIKKERCSHLNIYSPSYKLDFRLSASVEKEIKLTVPLEEMHLQLEREKDRISYFFEIFSFDLTKVTNKQAGENSESVTWEMEIEIRNKQLLRDEVDRFNQKRRNDFVTIAKGKYYISIYSLCAIYQLILFFLFLI
jgi:hypothetical protein